jgi:GWxTD domain-containing protein
VHHERTLDAVLTGGAGIYARDSDSVFQPTANIDFFAQTSILDLMAGVHVGFSKPITKAFTVGLRFPVSGSATNGLYADLGLLFFDRGVEDDAFSSGLRAALVGRVQSINLEYRFAGEVRQIFSGNLEAWAGVELGFFYNLLREEVHAPSRKDTLLADLRYIATSGELDQLREAKTDAELDSVVERFWKARDLTPATPLNEARREYEQRVRFVDSTFGSEYRMGVTTDQGRVYLLYGQPDRVESVSSTDETTRRYQLWIYDDRIRNYSTALFLFRTHIGRASSDIFSYHGDFRQIYSNIPGEPSEPLPADIPTSMRSFILAHSR